MRRFEILLPRRHNDGTAVPDALIGETIVMLREKFGAASFETQSIQGLWQHEGEVYSDDLVRVFVDVTDTDQNRSWFLEFKERLKRDYRQLDIWMTTYPIEVL
jgi:hypothetical protein